MKNNKKLSSSQEDYLEAILLLEKEKRVARVKDIANMLDVQMPSVTGALKNLRSHGLISYEKNSYITLTIEGEKIAECILSRHKAILGFFNVLGLEGKWVEEQACSIEHSINLETSQRLKKLTEWIIKTVFEEKKMTRDDWQNLLHQDL
ncbi:MAG: metal-dependent transcriptional regulator [Spirochaetales bacterium]|nr:metal-dependent transcriptional regulator [Spirochaetales bacterium]